MIKGYYKENLENYDKEVFGYINKEYERQQNQIELIASENIVSKAVLEAAGSVLTNKYAEGYPGKRYYGGCEFVDEVENLAINRLLEIFGCKYANVQPHSGSQANQAVFFSLLSPGDTILGMDLACGGHLTHGAKPNVSGKWFNAITYGVRRDNFLIDYDQIRELAIKHKPRLIIAGWSAYPRIIDFKIFREIADEVGAYLLVDMAHFSGLVAAGAHPSPIEYADVVTSTTHKTLRGPRGGIILSNNLEIGKKLNSAIFPGLQGGPLMHIIAAKAVAFGDILKPEFKTYIEQVKINAKVLAKTLIDNSINIITGGTDTHLLLVDLRNKNITGKQTEISLEEAGLTCNKNAIPFDTESPFITSGIRLGTPAGTSRGFKEHEFELIANLIARIINSNNEPAVIKQVHKEVLDLCRAFPIY